MKMTEQQLIDQIGLNYRSELDISYKELIALYAKNLSAISHKLNRSELSALTLIGVVLLQKSMSEVNPGIDEKPMLEVSTL